MYGRPSGRFLLRHLVDRPRERRGDAVDDGRQRTGRPVQAAHDLRQQDLAVGRPRKGLHRHRIEVPAVEQPALDPQLGVLLRELDRNLRRVDLAGPQLLDLESCR